MYEVKIWNTEKKTYDVISSTIARHVCFRWDRNELADFSSPFCCIFASAGDAEGTQRNSLLWRHRGWRRPWAFRKSRRPLSFALGRWRKWSSWTRRWRPRSAWTWWAWSWRRPLPPLCPATGRGRSGSCARGASFCGLWRHKGGRRRELLRVWCKSGGKFPVWPVFARLRCVDAGTPLCSSVLYYFNVKNNFILIFWKK